jgi:hypothetical protein
MREETNKKKYGSILLFTEQMHPPKHTLKSAAHQWYFEHVQADTHLAGARKERGKNLNSLSPPRKP